LPKCYRLSIDKKYNKYILYYENINETKRINLEMTLTHNDLQLIIDKFVNIINNHIDNINKKNNLQIKFVDNIKLAKPTMLEFSNVTNIITEEKELSNTEQNIETNTEQNIETNTEQNTETKLNH